ncbi:gap junction epsilon-1 protein [Clupea harengus]|uniref:Gap junction epsilon-1 protein n=1 Tax=Clupea harengus TaxID=7950 RepID=A0A6P8GHD7_CLUHA|nr:gap junction epsilon-1 protein [Clupea harengus]
MTICYNIRFSLHIFLSVCYLSLCLSGCLFVCLCTSGCVSIYLCIYISVLFFVIQLRPPTVIGQFHTLFFGSVRMFFLGVLGFAVYGNEALHFSCDPDSRELNLFCYNQFRPITPQVFWALQLVTVLVPGAVFHLYAACKNIDQEDILERPIYTVFYIISVLLRIILEVVAFWLQSHLFGFQVHPLYMCDASALEKAYNFTKCMVPEHFEKTIFLSAMYIFTIITVVLCVAEIFEILCRRLGYLSSP